MKNPGIHGLFVTSHYQSITYASGRITNLLGSTFSKQSNTFFLGNGSSLKFIPQDKFNVTFSYGLWTDEIDPAIREFLEAGARMRSNGQKRVQHVISGDEWRKDKSFSRDIIMVSRNNYVSPDVLVPELWGIRA